MGEYLTQHVFLTAQNEGLYMDLINKNFQEFLANKLEDGSQAKRVYSIYDYFLTREEDATLEENETSLILEHFLEVAQVPHKVGTFSYMLYTAIGPVICKQ